MSVEKIRILFNSDIADSIRLKYLPILTNAYRTTSIEAALNFVQPKTLEDEFNFSTENSAFGDFWFELHTTAKVLAAMDANVTINNNAPAVVEKKGRSWWQNTLIGAGVIVAVGGVAYLGYRIFSDSEPETIDSMPVPTAEE